MCDAGHGVACDESATQRTQPEQRLPAVTAKRSRARSRREQSWATRLRREPSRGLYTRPILMDVWRGVLRRSRHRSQEWRRGRPRTDDHEQAGRSGRARGRDRDAAGGGPPLPTAARVRRPGNDQRSANLRAGGGRSRRILGRGGGEARLVQARGTRVLEWDAALRQVVRRRPAQRLRTTASTATSRPGAATRSPTTGRASRATGGRSPTPSCSTEVCKCANALKELGVRRGDRVAIYMPMILELPIAMLACARIGAPHTVVFGGFSAEALARPDQRRRRPSWSSPPTAATAAARRPG